MGKKRKLSSSEPKPTKAAKKPQTEKENNPPRCDFEEREGGAAAAVVDEGGQWRNLELLLSIQSKDITCLKKVDVVFDYVSSLVNKEGGADREFNTLSVSRLITYISNWLQSLLITSEKKIRAGDKESEESQVCLDYRCWEVLKFCLEESSRNHVPLSLSRDLLRVISCVSRSALGLINSVDANAIESAFTNSKYEFYKAVSDCLQVLFTSHGQSLTANLELWTVPVLAVLEIATKVCGSNIQGSVVEDLLTNFSCLVLEPFSKFLKVHPSRKSGFHLFVDKLLEQLLCLLSLLCVKTQDGSVSVRKLFKLAEDILSLGLFHSVHLDEYLSLHCTERYSSSGDENIKSSRTTIKSYHRHLFDKLENFISERKVQALEGMGEMFRLFVECVNRHKDLVDSGGSVLVGSQSSTHIPTALNVTSGKTGHVASSGSEMRNSLFDVFVLMMEPLLLDLKRQAECGLQTGSSLQDIYHDVKSVNNLLSIMSQKRVYSRVEDNSKGACLNFFKMIYDLSLSCYGKLIEIWKPTVKGSAVDDTLTSIAKQFLLVVGNFLEIEYKVISDDLESTWLMILTFLAMVDSLVDVPEKSSMLLEGVNLGCQVINFYGDLRQVNVAIFTLCRGLRHLAFDQKDGDTKCPELLKSNLTLCPAFSKSGRLLVFSQKFRLAVCDAIKSIPEGQACGCIKALMEDISDSLAWMRTCSLTGDDQISDACHNRFSIQAELLAVVLSEIYSLVIDSLSVTAGNSYLMGDSIKKLIVVLGASMAHLVGLPQNGPQEFLNSVIGETFHYNKTSCMNDWRSKTPFVILFFFRLYVSFRSLYRQAVSLMPPDSCRKMSELMGDMYTAYSGQDFLERTNFDDAGYFAWIVQPSASLQSVVQFMKETFLQEGFVGHSSLIYVLHTMAFQRLADLSRQIRSLEYIIQSSESASHSNSNNVDLKGLRKSICKQETSLTSLKLEAAGLTGFILENLSSVNDKQLRCSTLNKTGENSCRQFMEIDTWDLGVCTLDVKTLPTAIWWLLCQNIDIWCNLATKKQLKLFLTFLISNTNQDEGYMDKLTRSCEGKAIKVTRHHISWAHIHDTNLYDQKFVCRYMAASVCKLLKECASLLFKDAADIDLELSSSDWTEVFNLLDNSTGAAVDKPLAVCYSHGKQIEGCCDRKISVSLINSPVAACWNMLDLLCNVGERSLSSKCLSQCLVCLVNFERLIVGKILDSQAMLCLHEHHEYLRLFISCRRAMKYLLMSFCETSKSSSLPLFSGTSLPVWLFKSLKNVVAWWNINALELNNLVVDDLRFSLMNHTSYLFCMLCKHQFKISLLDRGVDHSDKSDLRMKSNEDAKASGLVILVKALEEQTKCLPPLLKESFCSGNVKANARLTDLNKLSCVMSCIHGFLWGLESTLNDLSASGRIEGKTMKRRHHTLSQVNKFIDMAVEFLGLSSQIFLCNNQQMNKSCDGQERLKVLQDSNCVGINSSVKKGLNDGGEHGNDDDNQNARLGKMVIASADSQNVLRADNAYSASEDLTDSSFLSHHCLRIDFLESFLSGQNHEIGFFLRGLFCVASAIVKLSLHVKCPPLTSNLIQFFMSCSEVLLKKFSKMVDMPKPLSVVCLDGSVSFIEALGSQLLSSGQATPDLFTKLVKLHLDAIGKCISFQGKEATLASHDIESSTKTLVQGQGLDPTVSRALYSLGELKTRLRASLKVLIEKSSDEHVMSVVQVVEKAIVGAQEGSTMTYEVKRESVDGGTVSPMVAAGIDCLDLIIEFVKGKKRLEPVNRNLSSFVASLLNIIIHLQGPSIFSKSPNSPVVNRNPDSGSIVLMCVEVLTKVAGKHSMFQLESYHVGQSMHIPTTIFHDFLGVGKVDQLSSLWSCKHQESQVSVDWQFSVNLYAASCRLLWTIIKHHKSKVARCTALLQNSLKVLLHCLENVKTTSVPGDRLLKWEVEEGVKCATYLRRAYEEIRQQKDDLGERCFMFLADYIWLYSGYGPLRKGIIREVDEALRPGIYALLDVCSPDDLQYLHTVFGEGPCRSTLANLRHDYQRFFQYEGKV